MAKPRSLKIDAIKGLAIIFVVYGHIIEEGPNYQESLQFKILTSVMVPLFMFVSGFLSYGKPTNLRKKFNSLMIPFFSWSILKVLIETKSLDINNYIEFGSKLIYGIDYGLWFLPVLFEIFVLYSLIERISSKTKDETKISTFVAIFLIAQIPKTSFLGWHLVQIHLFYWIVGYFSNKYSTMIKNGKSVLILMGVLYPFLILGWNWASQPTPIVLISNNLNINAGWIIDLAAKGYNYLVSLAAISIVWLVVSNGKNYINRLLAFIGRYTIGIYAMHWHFILGQFYLVRLFFAVLIPIIISKILSKNKALSQILLGGRV